MKRSILSGIISICVVMLVFSSCVPKGSKKMPAEKVSEWTLVYAEGIVTMDGKEIQFGSVIKDGAVLKTSIDGLAEIVFSEKNIIRMGPDTTMRLEFTTLKRTVTIDRGTFTAVLRKLDRANGGSLDVRTPTAVAGVRGTSFFARVDPENEESYFCTCNGTLSMSAEDGSSSITKTASHHDITIYKGSGNSVVIVPPPPGFDPGHSDQDLEALALRIGETIDWAITDY